MGAIPFLPLGSPVRARMGSCSLCSPHLYLRRAGEEPKPRRATSGVMLGVRGSRGRRLVRSGPHHTPLIAVQQRSHLR